MSTRSATIPASRAAAFRRPSDIGPILACSLLLVAVALGATMLGPTSIPAGAVLGAIWNHVPIIGTHVDVQTGWERIVLDVRLPRVLAAGLAGAALASAGAGYQGVFRNPLAEPFLLGVASGAALGAAIGILAPIGAGTLGLGWVPTLAFFGAGIAVLLAYLAAKAGDAVSNASLILAGVAISSVAGAITSFLLLMSGERALTIFGFLFGSFNAANWSHILAALPYLVAGVVVLHLHARLLNVLQLDEEQAAQLGIRIGRTRLIVLGAASLAAAAAVAMAGVIGFVGLIVPHVARMAFGGDYRRVLPLSGLLGASFLILADMLARTVLGPQELPVGVVTAVVGGPFFLFLMRARRSTLA